MTTGIELPGMLLPEVDDATRREFLIGTAGLLLLPAACSGNGEGGNTASGETRTVEHTLGTTEVPVSPGRVMVADVEVTLPNLLALGVEPVAAGTNRYEEQNFPNVPQDLRTKVEDAEGLYVEPGINLERVAALAPDLIVGAQYYVEEAYGELSEIAPTVALSVTEADFTDYRRQLRAVARVFGLEGKAEELIEDFERSVAEASENLGDVGTVSMVSILPDIVRLYDSSGSQAGVLVEALGGRIVPESESLSGDLAQGASLELIPELTGDSLILLQPVSFQEADDYLSEVKRKPIWRNLPAVQNDRVLTLDVQLAGGNGGLPGLEATLDRLIEFFSGVGSDG